MPKSMERDSFLSYLIKINIHGRLYISPLALQGSQTIGPPWPEMASLLASTHPTHASPWRSDCTRPRATPFQQTKTEGNKPLLWQWGFLMA